MDSGFLGRREAPSRFAPIAPDPSASRSGVAEKSALTHLARTPKPSVAPMPRCVRHIAHLLLCIACLQLAGGHWVVLQVAAWTGMVVEYSAREGVVAGLGKTFDGQHPCSLCKVVSSGQLGDRDDSKQAPKVVAKPVKLESILLAEVELPPVLVGMAVPWPEVSIVAVGRMDAPPTPPPLA